MKKIQFTLFFLLFLVPTPAHANATLAKGAHVTSGLNPALFNALNNDVWMGDDSVIYDIQVGQNLAAYGAINAELIYRIPFNTNAATINTLKTLPNFHCRFELLNEYDLATPPYNTGTVAATLVVADIAVIDANCPNAYLILGLATQGVFTAKSSELWDALPQSAKDRIDAVSWHYYPTVVRDSNGVFDADATALEVKRYTRGTVRPWMNARGIHNGYNSEVGLDAAQVTKPEAALFVNALWADMETFAWLKGVLFYDYEYNGLNYVPLSNTTQTQLNKVGQAWRDLP